MTIILEIQNGKLSITPEQPSVIIEASPRPDIYPTAELTGADVALLRQKHKFDLFRMPFPDGIKLVWGGADEDDIVSTADLVTLLSSAGYAPEVAARWAQQYGRA